MTFAKDGKMKGKLGRYGVILYDGSCGACTFFIGEKSEVLGRYGFAVAPLQEPWVQEWTGLSEEDLKKSICLINSEKKLFWGADVYRELCRVIWYLKPVYGISKLPFFRAVFDFIYRLIANRRVQLSRVCGLQSRARYR
jgi:predicted DCC family thiol-disulfide oxidoreductase YuxK